MVKLLLIAGAYLGVLVWFRKAGGFTAAGHTISEWGRRLGVRE
jgi:hypothetical protein